MEKITFEFYPNEVTAFCNLLQMLRTRETPKFHRQGILIKNGLPVIDVIVQNVACLHLQKKVFKKHYAKLLTKDVNPETGKIAYTLESGEALAIYSYTAGKPEFYFFNCQVETSNL